MLVAINPFQDLSYLYSEENISLYNNNNITNLPPHVYKIGIRFPLFISWTIQLSNYIYVISASEASKNMRDKNRSQSIFVTGETGSGKTETIKHLIKFLCYKTTTVNDVNRKMIDSCIILDAFGNAETKKNRNSSRYCKIMEVRIFIYS